MEDVPMSKYFNMWSNIIQPVGMFPLSN